MSWARRFAIATCLGIAAGLVVPIANVPAGAVTGGIVRCGQFGFSQQIPQPASWYLSGCDEPAVSGGSGTLAQISQTASGITLVINWSAGKTTTIFLSSQTTDTSGLSCHFQNFGPHLSNFAYYQPGSVIADTTGFVPNGNFTVKMCAQISNLTGVEDAWNNGDLIIPNLTITTASLPPGNIGSSYMQTLAATRGNSPCEWRVVAGSLPRGLHLDKSTGTISGSPTKQSVTSSFTVEVRDTRTTTRPHTRNFDTATFIISIS
jgi:hypothetical protein